MAVRHPQVRPIRVGYKGSMGAGRRCSLHTACLPHRLWHTSPACLACPAAGTCICWRSPAATLQTSTSARRCSLTAPARCSAPSMWAAGAYRGWEGGSGCAAGAWVLALVGTVGARSPSKRGCTGDHPNSLEATRMCFCTIALDATRIRPSTASLSLPVCQAGCGSPSRGQLSSGAGGPVGTGTAVPLQRCRRGGANRYLAVPEAAAA